MRATWWKLLGLAGITGVAATGAVIARSQRRRRAYTPDEVRQRLHARLAETPEAESTTPAPTSPDAPDAPTGHSGT